MFFEIGPIKKDENFSYTIIKHPDTIFERSIGSGRKVVAYFSEDKSIYKGYVENDPIQFLNTARSLNLSNYIHNQLSSVCPHNLMGLDETFRTAIRGSFKEDEKEIYNHAIKENHWKAFIGPYPCKYEILEEWFNLVDIETEKYISDDDKIKGLDDDYSFLVYNIKFKTKTKMTITEFLQKLYLISYYLTIKHEITRTQNDKIAKFVSFCNNWIEKIDGYKRNRLINTLSGYRKSNIQKFENLLIDESELEDDEKESKRNEVDISILSRNINKMFNKKVSYSELIFNWL